MNYSILLQKGNWKYIANNESISFMHRDLVIANNRSDYEDLVFQLFRYNQTKKATDHTDQCHVKIYNSKSNTTLFLEPFEIPQCCSFLLTIRKYLHHIKTHTHIECCSNQLS